MMAGVKGLRLGEMFAPISTLVEMPSLARVTSGSCCCCCCLGRVLFFVFFADGGVVALPGAGYRFQHQLQLHRIRPCCVVSCRVVSCRQVIFRNVFDSNLVESSSRPAGRQRSRCRSREGRYHHFSLDGCHVIFFFISLNPTMMKFANCPFKPRLYSSKNFIRELVELISVVLAVSGKNSLSALI